MPTKKIRLENSAGVLKRQIDINVNDHIAFYDENDNEIMDMELHGSRHADGAEDALPSNSISNAMIQDGAVTETKIQDGAVTNTKIQDGAVTNTKIQDGAVTETKIQDGAVTNTKIQDGAVTSNKAAAKTQYRNVAVTTGVAVGVSGSPTTIASLDITTDYSNLLPLTIKATPSGLGTGETVTFRVVVTLDDSSTVTLASKTTAAGSTATETFTPADYDFTLIGDGRRITRIELTAESSATATSATATATISAHETYI